MAWIVLFISSVLEAVWATALGESESFSKLVPTLIFAAGSLASMWTLAYATKTIPIGIAYAVWAGLGAVFTVAWAFINGTETGSVLKIAFLAGIVVCIVGLKLTSSPRADKGVQPAEQPTDVS